MYSLLLSSKERVGTSQNHRGFFPTHSTFLPGVQYQPLNLPFFFAGGVPPLFFPLSVARKSFPLTINSSLFSSPSFTDKPLFPSFFTPFPLQLPSRHCGIDRQTLSFYFLRKEGRKEKRTAKKHTKKKRRDACLGRNQEMLQLCIELLPKKKEEKDGI